MQGQKVQTSNQKQINVSNLCSGIYNVRIENKNSRKITKKMVKN
jgi:hypothetical protein